MFSKGRSMISELRDETRVKVGKTQERTKLRDSRRAYVILKLMNSCLRYTQMTVADNETQELKLFETPTTF